MRSSGSICNVEDADARAKTFTCATQLRSNADEPEAIATIPRRGGHPFVMSVTERVGHGPNRRQGRRAPPPGSRAEKLDDLRGSLSDADRVPDCLHHR